MKKIMIILIFCLCLTGCYYEKKDNVITYYVNDNMFVKDGHDITYYESIHNKYIDTYNQLLSDKGYDFTIEVKYYDKSDYQSISSKKDLIHKIMNEHPEADIVDFYDSAIDYYEPLNSYFTEDIKNEMSNAIPKNSLLLNQINNQTYSIEKNGFKYTTSALYVKPEYYKKHKKIFDAYKDNPIALLQQLSQKKDWDKNCLLMDPYSGWDLDIILEQEYQPIAIGGCSTGLYIRRSDNKVVAFYEDKNIMNAIYLLASLGKDNAYGRLLNPEELESIQSKDAFYLSFSSYEYPEELYQQNIDNNRMTIRYGEGRINAGGKLSILQSSDNKEDAFLSLILMNTDRNFANAMMYGEIIEDKNQIIESESAGIGGNWNSYANYLITNPSTKDPIDKKELAFQYINSLDLSKQLNFHFMLNGNEEIIDKLATDIFPELTRLIINEDGLNNNQINEQLESLKKKAIEMDINKIINDFQEQANKKKQVHDD